MGGMFRLTKHFHERARTRGLTLDVQEFIVTWGTTIEAPYGASYFTVVWRDLPYEARSSGLARRAEGWVVVVAGNGAMLTCYRRRDAWHALRRERDVRVRGMRRAA